MLLLLIYLYIIDVMLAIFLILLFDRVANRKCYKICEIP